MMAHGYRGAGEIARGVEGLFAFACALTTRFDRQFDLVFDATLGDPNVDAFLRANNPAARAAIFHRFRDARARGLWQPRRNAAAELLDRVEA
jgi:cobaltochelatase CobN